MTKEVWAWVVVALAVLFALSPLGSDGFNGFTKDQFPVVLDHWPAQPAGWAFSIWGVIYLWMIAGLIFGTIRHGDDANWQQARPALAVGVPWIAKANPAPVAATVMIVVMAAGAIAAVIHAGRRDLIWQAEPLGLYAGWLTAATGVAIAVTLSGHGILPGNAATLILLALVLTVALAARGLVLSAGLRMGAAGHCRGQSGSRILGRGGAGRARSRRAGPAIFHL